MTAGLPAQLLKTHPSIDNSGAVPSFDMMLLGTGGDGHCGCLFPDTAEIKATGTGAGYDAKRASNSASGMPTKLDIPGGMPSHKFLSHIESAR